MTLEQAKELAAMQMTTHLVWRLPAWPTGVYGVITKCPLPSEAEVIEVKPMDRQGSLF